MQTINPAISAAATVRDNQGGVGLEPQLAAGAKVLTEVDLRAIPNDSDELLAQFQNMAASSGSVPGQATMTLDGF